LRLRRQGHALRVDARQPLPAGTSDSQRHAVLFGFLLDGRVRGHHRRRAQSVRPRHRSPRLRRRRGARGFLDREDHPRHRRAGHAGASPVLPERPAPAHERARAREDPAERRAADAGHGDSRPIHGLLPADDLLRYARHRARAPAMTPRPLKVGLVQMAMGEEPARNLAKAIDGVRDAAKRGARLVVLPELFRSRYFCQSQDAAQFGLAEEIPGPSTDTLGDLARELSVTLVASLFEKRAAGLYHNTAAVIDADRGYLGKYRKMH